MSQSIIKIESQDENLSIDKLLATWNATTPNLFNNHHSDETSNSAGHSGTSRKRRNDTLTSAYAGSFIDNYSEIDIVNEITAPLIYMDSESDEECETSKFSEPKIIREEHSSFENIVKMASGSRKSINVLSVNTAPVAGNARKSIRKYSNLMHSNMFSKKSSNCVDKRVTINVGGIRYETYSNTLKLIPESRLANLSETNSDYNPVRNEYFFDRHPGAFVAILNFFRTGKLHAPTDICVNLFNEELNFWGINVSSIEPCCWSAFSLQCDADETLRKLMYKDELEGNEDLIDNDVENNDEETSFGQRMRRLPSRLTSKCNFSFLAHFYDKTRSKVWRFFEDRHSSIPAKIFFWIAVIILFISLINFVLETSLYFRVPFEKALDKNLTRAQREEQTQPHGILRSIEIFCNVFFTVELFLRFLSSPNKLRFMCGPYNILEFMAILPIFFPTERPGVPKTWTAKVHNYLEVFYILRILRIFVLVPKYSGLRVLLLTLKTSLGELFLYMMLLLMTLMLFASFEYYAEQIFEEDNNQFESILTSLWWAIVTMTTLGYGDIVPSTALGRIVGALCALCGLVFLALPIPVIVNNFTTYYAQAKGYQKLDSYKNEKRKLFRRAVALHLTDAGHAGFNEDRRKKDLDHKIHNSSKERIAVDPLLLLESPPLKRLRRPTRENFARTRAQIKDEIAIQNWQVCSRNKDRRNALAEISKGLLGSSTPNVLNLTE